MVIEENREVSSELARSASDKFKEERIETIKNLLFSSPSNIKTECLQHTGITIVYRATAACRLSDQTGQTVFQIQIMSIKNTMIN